ncbi:hypothetical protein QO010_004239 [Caulobacter ginsengisoli]|uniref:Pilus formation protein N-terminal domain-containing protein n=1 Tax=Caulobacter ginsengisoli TaxID=400775 RepID=A0ABU0IWQ5_9CAUL|nr:pilus assembly protein N-terminal domain-containing protein [Caulobacter ginsengisoli]MDQ0466446.1 hypothetical protein [Caulobacter ginsengisoli]
MRRLPLVLALSFALASTLAQPALAESLQVRIDQAARLMLASPARDVIIGNPAVADVTVIDGRSLIITGKGYGVTNLIVVDRAGRTIVDRQIVVSGPDGDQVSFYRGASVYNYACSPRCQRQPLPGETDTAYGPWAAPAATYADRARNAAAAGQASDSQASASAAPKRSE